MLERLRFHPQFVVCDTRLVTITTEDWLTTNNYRQQISARWPFLYDEERVVQKGPDIKGYCGTSHDAMIPHMLMPGRGLEVYNGYYYWRRPSIAELYADPRELGQRTQRDWDITEPGLRQKWQAGEKADFCPYREE